MSASTTNIHEDSLVEYGFNRVIITITAVLCALLEIVDTTIVNVALNDMRGSLGATLTDVAWVITAYAIANVIVIPMTSWLSQQFGRRNYFAASIIIFTSASFLCGNASGIWELIIFRFIQGLGGEVISNISNYNHRKLSSCKKRNGTSYLWNGCNCWSNTWATFRRIFSRHLFLALYFLY